MGKQLLWPYLPISVRLWVVALALHPARAKARGGVAMDERTHVGAGRQGGCEGGGEGAAYRFDAYGELVDEPVGLPGGIPEGLPPPELGQGVRQPCAISTLNGSWFVQLAPAVPPPPFALSQVRGPMRIEVGASSLRASGDIYVRRFHPPISPAELEEPVNSPLAGAIIDTEAGPGAVASDGAPHLPWYPQLPINQYSWYFRSTGATYAAGTLILPIERHLWDQTTQEFTQTDTGTMIFTCRRRLIEAVGVPLVMTGRAQIGGRTYQVTATKTSNLYRGCRIEADVMVGRQWPQSATLCNGVTTAFRQVYGTAGWDVEVTVDELNVPEDASLTNAELQTLLTTHRGAGGANEWRLWLLAGSSQGTTFGIMFDQDAVPREGAVGFADATLGTETFIEASARGRPLDEVPAAFLRTLTHEAGHALNLFHPKHDVHSPPIGIEIMNQTGDVMGFASEANPYPCNASFAFAEHDRMSLIHSPDPQVRPGWKPFGWGHGSLSSGLPLPVDADGLVTADRAEGLRLELRLPVDVYVGEYVIAEVTLTNTGDQPREVTTRLNLAEGDLRLLHALPNDTVEQVRDVVVACGPRPTVMLPPGESITGRMQILFTSEGVTFDQPGPHRLRAELDIDGFSVVTSPRMTVQVWSAATEDERDIAATTLDRRVGMALALGDFGADDATRERLASVAEAHSDHDTGAACALVLANALARPHMDYRADTVRDTDPDEATAYLDRALEGRSAERVLELAATVASPTEKDAPVLQLALDRLREADTPQEDLSHAEAVAEDFVAPSPR